MASSTGALFRVTTFGESHGGAVGCVLDGCPPLLELSEKDIQPDLDRRRPGQSRLAEVVEQIDWPAGDGYFWMAGESAQMRAIRKHLMRERHLPSSAYDVMGYWRGATQRQPRAVDPGPIWRAGKAAGRSDEQIWADYDEASKA